MSSPISPEQAELAAKPCPRPCTVCEGQDHHWMPDCDEESGEPVMVCKHCDARREYFDEYDEEDEIDLYERGNVVWHSSYEDAGPDCGISVGLGAGTMLWCGEISRRQHEEAGLTGRASNALGSDLGWWIILYHKQSPSNVIGRCVDRHVARAMVDLIAATINAKPSLGIMSTPGIQGGKPCFEGTRLPVEIVAAIAMSHGINEAIRTYPQLTVQHVLNAIAFMENSKREGKS